jgi:peptidoglycan/xylan/chitin deacetylase (PgdA/CDA1 family)
MTLADEFLRYPARHKGPDHARYQAQSYRDRAPLKLPGAAKLGVWTVVLLEFFPLDPEAKPFKAPGSMQTPYPDLRHYTVRDYGNRVGVYRMLEVLQRAGVQATFAVQGMVAQRYPSLIRDIAGEGHEICAHGWSAGTLHYTGLAPEQEQDAITRTLSAIAAITGAAPSGWISPARAESFATPDHLAAAGIRWFADWAHDALPVPFQTAHGTLISLPLSNELDDWQILAEYRRPEPEWVQQITDAAAFLRAEADRFGPQILSMTVRPYLLGQPYRVGAFRDALHGALATPDAVSVTGPVLASGI